MRGEIIEGEAGNEDNNGEIRGVEKCGQQGRGEEKFRKEEDAVRSQGQPQGQLSE